MLSLFKESSPGFDFDAMADEFKRDELESYDKMIEFEFVGDDAEDRFLLLQNNDVLLKWYRTLYPDYKEFGPQFVDFLTWCDTQSMHIRNEDPTHTEQIREKFTQIQATLRTLDGLPWLKFIFSA